MAEATTVRRQVGVQCLDLTERPWWHRAACNDKRVDLSIFHPDRGGKPEPALKVCRRCPVQRECLENALEEEAHEAGQPSGVRGAMTAKDRAPLVRERKKAIKRESPRVTRIRRMAKAGMSYEEMGREEGIEPQSVGAICRQHGIHVPAKRCGPPIRRRHQPVGGGAP